jgi:hypothetical protein
LPESVLFPAKGEPPARAKAAAPVKPVRATALRMTRGALREARLRFMR